MLHAVLILGFVVAIFLPDRLLAQPRKPATITEIATGDGTDRAERGSPIARRSMALVPTNTGGVALAGQPPHPFAAMPLVDFVLSDAVKILEKLRYSHPSLDYGF